MAKPEFLGKSGEFSREDEERRRQHAIEHRLILLHKKPHYSGRSNGRGEPDDIFEIYIKKIESDGKFIGHIEDIFGTANVHGEISQNNVVFYKKYIPGKSSPEISQKEVMYEGCLSTEGDDKYYFGQWRETEVSNPRHGEFALWANLPTTPRSSLPKP